MTLTIGYLVIGAILGLLFTSLVMEDQAMDDKVILLGMVTIFWIGIVGLGAVVAILYGLVKGADFVVRSIKDYVLP